jgi:hypothetical protein
VKKCKNYECSDYTTFSSLLLRISVHSKIVSSAPSIPFSISLMVMPPYKSTGKNTVYIVLYGFNGERKLKASPLNNTFIEQTGYIEMRTWS